MRLFALDSLPALVVPVHLYLTRVQGRLAELVFRYVVLSSAVLTWKRVLVGPLGIAGWAWHGW